MKSSLTFALLAAPAAFAADWQPPEKPDPTAILREASADARAGRHADALAKHVWFHEHALEHEPAQYGVRLSFALSRWKDLAAEYPPASEALAAARDRAEAAVGAAQKPGRSMFRFFHVFHDAVALNSTLGEEGRTADLFRRLHEERPDVAREVFRIARPALIAGKEYRLAGKYADPASIDTAAEGYRSTARLSERDGFGPELREHAERSFRNDAATLVALLVLNDRRDEAEEVARKARAVFISTALDRSLDRALKGEIPPAYP